MPERRITGGLHASGAPLRVRVPLRGPGMTEWVWRVPSTCWRGSETAHSYLGVTNDLARRVWEHKSKVAPSFTTRYGVDRLVWYEVYERIDEAIAREKQIKKWRRDWKIALIHEMNPDWADLYEQLNG